MTQNKAQELFELYKQAELSGNDEQAETLEGQLNKGGWKIAHGNTGWTIERIGSGFLTESQLADANLLFPQNRSVDNYRGTDNTPGSNRWIWIGIASVLGLLLIIGIIAAVKAYKKGKHEAIAQL